ncbi:MAG: hypothetical protein J6F31_00845 [Oscillospiraceae bacterium]|nr:hypothetical protein [Oscillospiraceae bacterium]
MNGRKALFICIQYFVLSSVSVFRKTVSAEEIDNDLRRQMTVSASDFVKDYYSVGFKGKEGSVDEIGKNYIILC